MLRAPSALAPLSSTRSATVGSTSTRRTPWTTLSSTPITWRTQLVRYVSRLLPTSCLRLTFLIDVEVLREGIKLARRVGEADPLNNVMLDEINPGLEVQSDQQWEDWLRGQGFTEFHPSSTCAMLPLEQGGVVDANLRVYGLSNVRVADASVPPIAFSAHLTCSTYGLAEQASTIIRAFYNGASSTGTNVTSGNGTHSSGGSTGSFSGDSSGGSKNSSSTTSSTSSSTSSSGSNGGLLLHPWTLFIAVAAFIASG